MEQDFTPGAIHLKDNVLIIPQAPGQKAPAARNPFFP